MVEGPKGGLIRAMQALYDAGSLAGLDDAELLARFLGRGDAAEAAFEAIVARHGAMVYDVCRTVTRSAADADDAFQAVFLILACRAAGVRRRGALGPWLFGVARRTALQARKQSARRREREAAAASLTPTSVDPRDPDDAVAALMEEVDRLPSRYRDPVVLCHLQGLTYEAAAGRLGCPLGTLSVRLKRARERLRTRLERRGVDAPAIPPPVAAVPEALAAATSRLALLVPPSLRGGVPVSVLTLTRGALRTMRMTRIVVASTAFLALAAGAWAWNASASGYDERPLERSTSPPADPEPINPYRLIGRVFDRDTGRGIDGAIIEAQVAESPKATRIVRRRVRSGPDGTYSFDLPAGHGDVYSIVPPRGYWSPEADTYGIQRFAVSGDTPIIQKDFEVRRGVDWEFHVVGPDGRPVAAAIANAWSPDDWNCGRGLGGVDGRVQLTLRAGKGEAAGWIGAESPTASLSRFHLSWDDGFNPDALRSVTKLDGTALRFWLTDAGGKSAIVEPKDGARIEPQLEAGRLVLRVVADLVAAGVLAEVSGVVVDETGEPLPGARVEAAYLFGEGATRWSSYWGGGDLEPSASDPFAATTDALGHYRLAELPATSWGERPSSLHLVVSCAGRAVVCGDSFAVGKFPHALPPITLPRGHSVVGKVVGPNDVPIVGAVVWPVGEPAIHSLLGIRTESDGAFRIDGLTAGRHEIYVMYGTMITEGRPNLVAEPEPQPAVIRLVPAPEVKDAKVP